MYTVKQMRLLGAYLPADLPDDTLVHPRDVYSERFDEVLPGGCRSTLWRPAVSMPVSVLLEHAEKHEK